MENKQPSNLKSLQQKIIFIILHVSFSVAVMLLYIFKPGPTWDSSLHILECETPVAEENRNEKWQNFRKALTILLKNAMCPFRLHWPKQIRWPDVGTGVS